MKEETTNQDQLLSEFAEPSQQEWREAADALLKGKPFDKLMTRKTLEGIVTQPIFWREVLETLPQAGTLPGFDGYLRGVQASGYAGASWAISQELPYGEPYEFNRVALADMMRGQDSLNILLDIATLNGQDPDQAAAGEVGACGLSLAHLEDMKTAFKDVLPEAVSFHFRCGCTGIAVAGFFVAWLREQKADLTAVRGSFGMDPVAVLASAGKLPVALERLVEEQSILADYCARALPRMRSVGVSTQPYHQAGASAVEELGFALATGSYYLNAMLEKGMDVNAAACQIRFSLQIGPNFFMEIAKIRAMRMLWAQVVKSYGGGTEAQKIELHARTGLRNKTRNDPYVNMLRTTTEAMSAVIAGVDSLCVGCFDEVIRLPDTFSRRIARNTQVILQEECEMTAVADPAGGSWAVEWLTNEVAQRAWSVFQEVECEGGIVNSLTVGSLRERIQTTASAQEKLLNQRRVSLVGTNVYPDMEEKPLDPRPIDYAAVQAARAKEIENIRITMDEAQDIAVIKQLEEILTTERDQLVEAVVKTVSAGATVGEITRALRSAAEPGEICKPVPSLRLAAKYEALRTAVDAFAEKTGTFPAIMLCNLGPLRRHKLRADFTKSFFETGGFNILFPEGFGEPQQAVEALRQCGAKITVVCGTDDDYAAQFVDYAQAIKQALPDVKVILAGFPGDNEETYRAAGMDDFIFIKSDNYATNANYLRVLGVI